MRVELRFYAELNDFLPPSKRFRTIVRTPPAPAPVKDVIEAEGVPHTDVDLIAVNGESVGFDYQVRDGDRIAVYPVFESFDLTPVSRLRPEPLREPRFVVDVHLGTLARYLRLFGFDTLYDTGWDDEDLARVSAGERRVLVTRDRGLLKRSIVTHGCFVRAAQPRLQLLELARRLQLLSKFRPFTRCLECNAAPVAASKDAVAGDIEEGTRRRHDAFGRCAGCGRVYWGGSHYERLSAFVTAVRTDLGCLD